MRSFCVLLALTLTPLSSWAVRTVDCPHTMSIRYQYVSALPLESVLQSNGLFLDQGILGRIHQALAEVKTYETTVRLKSTANSKCIYLPDSEEEMRGANEVRLYTSKGKDILRVPINLGKIDGSRGALTEYVWVYHRVRSYAVHGVETKPVGGSRVLGYFDYGAPHTHFGWVNEITIK